MSVFCDKGPLWASWGPQWFRNTWCVQAQRSNSTSGSKMAQRSLKLTVPGLSSPGRPAAALPAVVCYTDTTGYMYTN
ncbi:hypothetical protein CgunFtcFv8_007943 [Champsocephalus gunnari]|uniref:Uncharacterized protein n=1 Tax=Champsocephalus gunnari TaxID=52237 RepID=A0AAN8D7K5_CHAGU|nr:hypothetical protein CgunFtcFv8_007943 [Champsocephalus gunnari]